MKKHGSTLVENQTGFSSSERASDDMKMRALSGLKTLVINMPEAHSGMMDLKYSKMTPKTNPL
jgi:hypothetical protein